MNNEEAFHFYTSNSEKSCSDISRLFIGKYHMDEGKFDYFRRKFAEMKRLNYLKRGELITWNQLYFCTPIEPSLNQLPQSSFEDSAIGKLQASQSRIELAENISRVPQKHINQLQNRAIRNRLAELRSHVEAVAQHEDCTPKMIAMYLVKLYSSEDHDISTANVVKRYKYRRVWTTQ